jgi:16S rRNA (uracil1498-N3)-methyltransferase
MTARYYAPHLSDTDACELEGSEFHHLTRVMRAGPGDQITLFDGNGHSAVAQVVELSKSRALLRILNRRSDSGRVVPHVVVASAIPKADRFRWLVEKATELGVGRLIPLQTARSVTEPGSNKLDKMRATVIEACKQSGRDRLMTIDAVTDWKSFLGSAPELGCLVLADPSGAPLGDVPEMRQRDRPLILLVGPEGGFTEAEVGQAVEAGGYRVSIGPGILRTETAAIALAALFLLSQAGPSHASIDSET